MAAREHLVVVLPGIGGTQLAVPDQHGGRTDELAWSASLKDVGLLRYPDRLSLGTYPRLVPAGLIPTRKAFGLWTVVPGYDGLLTTLKKRAGAVLDDGTAPEPNLDATLVAVGYDFRLGVADAAQQLDAELRRRLEHRWPQEADRERRVVFVAHSMGGLVARYWVSVLGGAPLCRGIITLGTPHRGAPKALEVMANGLPVSGFHVTTPIPLAREWPGMADLLPRYPAVRDTSDGRKDGPVKRLRPQELPLSWLTGQATRAHEMHLAIERGWAALPTPPAIVPRIGFGHATLRACTWDGARVRVTKDPPVGPDLGGWAHDLGDGTVPMFCGLPVEMDHYPRENLRVHRRHGPIAELKEITSLLDAFGSDASLSAYRAADEADVGLGLDLDEVHLACRPILIVASPVSLAGHDVGAGPDVDAGRVAVWATARRLPDAGGDRSQESVDVRLAWDADRGVFVGELPCCAPGLVEVTVSARSLSDAPATQVVEVLDDAGLE